MPTTRERSDMMAELASSGYSVRDIDSWPPKTTLYRHKPMMNGDAIVKDIGDAIHNLPGSPDYILQKSKIGLLQWPPSGTCKCRWCTARSANGKKETKEVKVEEDPSVITIEV